MKKGMFFLITLLYKNPYVIDLKHVSMEQAINKEERQLFDKYPNLHVKSYPSTIKQYSLPCRVELSFLAVWLYQGRSLRGDCNKIQYHVRPINSATFPLKQSYNYNVMLLMLLSSSLV